MNNQVMLSLLLLVGGSAAAAPVKMQRPVPLMEDNDISTAIKQECGIGERLAHFVQKYSVQPIEFSDDAPALESGRVLQMEIVDAVAMGNAWLGHQKYAKVRGTLYQDGVKVASFKGRRNSMGGAFAGFKGSCSVLDRTIKALGEDVAGWLENPADGVNLGD
ncbi:hypothetical protein [Stenotrophomonas sp. YIM B06876]|uniref:hypothetical protein n=1 Tax=Stenotrophomonas sp. YIM B06876 TaxID=3060211 RepID=UPI002739BA9B|nr:hypothetical protein [Stenotrophomonas sp. YIM B06876]